MKNILLNKINSNTEELHKIVNNNALSINKKNNSNATANWFKYL